MKILIATVIFIIYMLYMHRRHCKNHPLTIAGRRVRYIKNYRNRCRAQIKFPIWGWLDVTFSTILDSTFDYFPEFKTEEEAIKFLEQLNPSMISPQDRGTVKIDTNIKRFQ